MLHTMKPDLKPEIAEFVARADAVCKAKKWARATLSNKIFDQKARVLDNLARGRGCNVTNFFDAEIRLAQIEAEIAAELRQEVA